MIINGLEIRPDADLIGADLTDANLTGADLTGADLYGANLRRANLTRVRASLTTQWPTDLLTAMGVVIR